MEANRYAITDHMASWLTACPERRGYAAYALRAAREGLDLNAVDNRWREFASALFILYQESPNQAAAAFNFCEGFLCALNIQYGREGL